MAKINKKKFLNALKDSGGVITSIANRLEVTRKAVYEYIERNPELRKFVEDEKEKILDMAEISLFSQVKDKDFGATKYILSTRGKSRGYIEKTESEITHKGEGIKLIINQKDE